MTTVNEVLGIAGMILVPPEGRTADADLAAGDGGREVFADLARLPRPAALVPLPGYRPRWRSTPGRRCRRCARPPIALENRWRTRNPPAAAPPILDKASVDRSSWSIC